MALSKKARAHGDHPALCIVAKAAGSPRFCADYRNAINKYVVRETWPMPDIEYHVDTVGGAKCITVCNLQSSYWQKLIRKKTAT